ncbi:MAG: hypothetical protein KDC92_07205 [Bacteroidetes bacterium]|nr:hypothetical protein [Bacteroidota bacterium]
MKTPSSFFFKLILQLACVLLANGVKCQNVVSAFSIEIPKQAAQHIYFDDDLRWNFVYLNDKELVVLITNQYFEANKILQVSIKKYGVQQLIGIKVDTKTVQILYYGGNKNQIQTLEFHKYNEQLTHKIEEVYLQKLDVILDYFIVKNEFVVLIYKGEHNQLALLKTSSSSNTKIQNFKIEFPLAKEWHKANQNSSMNAIGLASFCSTYSTEMLMRKVKCYLQGNKLQITYDEMYKTHLFSIDLTTYHTTEKCLNATFPFTASNTGHFTNSVLFENSIYQAFCGPWGVSVQRHDLLADSSHTPWELALSNPVSAELVLAQKETALLSLKDCSFLEWCSSFDQDSEIGLKCSKKDGIINFSLGIHNWKNSELKQAKHTAMPQWQHLKINGIKYNLPNKLSDVGQIDYYISKHTTSAYLDFAYSLADGEFILIQPNIVSEHSMPEMLEDALSNALILPSYQTYIINCNRKYYGFYSKMKKQFTIMETTP